VRGREREYLMAIESHPFDGDGERIKMPQKSIQIIKSVTERIP
jgi:hypothetical protein